MKALALAVPLALAACNATGPAAPTGFTLTGAPDGVTVAQEGDDRSIPFGTNQAGTLAMIRSITGVTPRQIPCAAPTRDAYITQFGMVTIFEGNTFVGWRRVAQTGGARCS